jgi:hypothetical protein
MYAQLSSLVSCGQNYATVAVVSDDNLLASKAWILSNLNQGKECVHIYMENVAANVIPLWVWRRVSSIQL